MTPRAGLALLLAGCVARIGSMAARQPRARRASPRMLDVETLRSLGPTGMAAAVCFADMVPGVPTQPIAIATGALFGFQQGLVCVCAGQAAATAAAVSLARSPAAKSVLSKAEGALSAPGPLKSSLDTIAATINSQSAFGVFTTIIGVRQSPIIPFSLGNYYVGLFTRAPLASVVAGTIVGCLPINALWTYVGATTSGALGALLAGEKVDVSSIISSPAGEALEALGGLATAALAVFVFQAVRKGQVETLPGDD